MTRKKGIVILATFILIAVSCAVVLLQSTQLVRGSSVGSAEGRNKYYKSILIESGDTLWDIANTYRDEHHQSVTSYISELKQMNSLRDDRLISGEYLIVSYYNEL
ncbi:MAG: LysM peptidoglycan-binding domain-containing protein [Lachnospiraceae bacterium]